MLPISAADFKVVGDAVQSPRFPLSQKYIWVDAECLFCKTSTNEASVSLCMSVFLCLHFKGKTAWAISAKPGTHILYDSIYSMTVARHALTQRSRSHGCENHRRTVTNGEWEMFCFLHGAACRM